MICKRLLAAVLVSVVNLGASATNPAAELWSELKAKRDALAGYHQEFAVSQANSTPTGEQTFDRRLVIDVAHHLWREHFSSGSVDFLLIFDGSGVFQLEVATQEYMHWRDKPRDSEPLPSPYSVAELNWPKAVEVQRGPCGLKSTDHQCVVLDVPVNPHLDMMASGKQNKTTEGASRIVLDLETGLLVSSRIAEVHEIQNGSVSRLDVTYKLTSMDYGVPPQAALFSLPHDAKEVRELSSRDQKRFKERLLGKPAPEWTAVDIHGKPITLSALKGHVVLLDFWTTWCEPCRADGPALDSLYRKYGGDLVIIGISVDEERSAVEKFLNEHPHAYSIVLTSENDVPLPYRVHSYPTYVAIDRDGRVASVVQDDGGYRDVRKLLAKTH